MKIGHYCESPIDRAALEVFTEGILGEPPERINMDLEAHSVPAFFNTLPGVFKGVHYNSDAEGLVIVVDCDDTELHEPAHDKPGGACQGCRLCQIRSVITKARTQLSKRDGRPELKVAIGLAVPEIEAWYLVGKKHEVGEAVWRVGLAESRPPFTKKQLKEWVYGKDRLSFQDKTERAVIEAKRVIRNLTEIETRFPSGFRTMAQEIRTWRPPPPLAGPPESPG